MKVLPRHINFSETAPTSVEEMKNGEMVITPDGLYARVSDQVLFQQLLGMIGDEVVMIGENTYDLLTDTEDLRLHRMFGTDEEDIPGVIVYTIAIGSPTWNYADPEDIAYCGNGIFVCITTDDLTYVLKSTDYGISWTNLGEITGKVGSSQVHAMAYTGNGHLVIGMEDSAPADIYWSDDYGESWQTVVSPAAGEQRITAVCDLGGGIALLGTGAQGHILRSTDYGETWEDRGKIHPQAGNVETIVHTGNGHCIASTNNNVYIFRSADYGLTWQQAGGQLTGFFDPNEMVYCGNGILVGVGSGNINDQVIRSTNYGSDWSKIETNTVQLLCVEYLGDGKLLAGDSDGGLWWSDDYGASWDLKVHPLNPNEDGDDIYSIRSTVGFDISGSVWTTTTTTTT